MISITKFQTFGISESVNRFPEHRRHIVFLHTISELVNFKVSVNYAYTHMNHIYSICLGSTEEVSLWCMIGVESRYTLFKPVLHLLLGYTY